MLYYQYCLISFKLFLQLQSSTPAEATSILIDNKDLAKTCGVSYLIQTEETKQEVVEHMSKFLVITRNKDCYDE